MVEVAESFSFFSHFNRFASLSCETHLISRIDQTVRTLFSCLVSFGNYIFFQPAVIDPKMIAVISCLTLAAIIVLLVLKNYKPSISDDKA